MAEFNKLVTLDEASHHLRRDTSDDNTDLELKIFGASDIILRYINVDVNFLDSSGDVIVDENGDPQNIPPAIKIATLMLIGELNKNREGEGAIDETNLPAPVRAMLFPWKQPSLA